MKWILCSCIFFSTGIQFICFVLVAVHQAMHGFLEVLGGVAVNIETESMVGPKQKAQLSQRQSYVSVKDHGKGQRSLLLILGALGSFRMTAKIWKIKNMKKALANIVTNLCVQTS